MPSEDRQRIIETNRSLRLIKNELESLLEKGVLTDSAFDAITGLLPAESPLSGAGAAPRATTVHGLPTPAPTASPAPSSPTASFANLSLNAGRNSNAAPPSYAQSQSTGPAPSLPSRSPAPLPSKKPVLARAKALYRYAATDARDVSFERDDPVAVLEHMNADWWMGRNERTAQEGIFPRSYVVVVDDATQDEKKPAWDTNYGAQPPQQQQQQQYGGYPPPPPGRTNVYNADVPPMAVAEQGGGQGGGRFGDQGKKFGKKLGNAAIFGAGASIGSNIVNSIF